MSERTPYGAELNRGGYPLQGATKRDTVGIGGLEARIDECMSQIDGIGENLYQAMTRLYPPRPSPVPSTLNDGAISPSIENSLNRVINKLQELRRLSQELING